MARLGHCVIAQALPLGSEGFGPQTAWSCKRDETISFCPHPITTLFTTEWHPCQSTWDTLAPRPRQRQFSLRGAGVLPAGETDV